MSDETMKGGHSNDGHSGHETEFEREDLGTRGVFAFMIGLAVIGVVIYFIIVGMYSFLDNYERSQMATASPLVTSKGAMSRVVTQADMDKTFKDNGAPMLEVIEGVDLRKDLIKQEDQLNSYGWVDKDAGVAHIPIEHAMELIVQRGLPVYPQGTADAKTDAGKVPAQKSVPKQ
ncbi:MAG: hypothetical protein ABSD76_15405 [Terriglobales bacterium]|jgi:hypothetical protein